MGRIYSCLSLSKPGAKQFFQDPFETLRPSKTIFLNLRPVCAMNDQQD